MTTKRYAGPEQQRSLLHTCGALQSVRLSALCSSGCFDSAADVYCQVARHAISPPKAADLEFIWQPHVCLKSCHMHRVTQHLCSAFAADIHAGIP